MLIFLLRILGKPLKSEWPEKTAPIKWSAFDVTEKVDLRTIAPNLCENALSLVTVFQLCVLQGVQLLSVNYNCRKCWRLILKSV